jgi:hypothetical protein
LTSSIAAADIKMKYRAFVTVLTKRDRVMESAVSKSRSAIPENQRDGR